LTAPIAAFAEARATEEADASRSGHNAVEECQGTCLHQPTNGAKRPEEGRKAQ